MSVEEAEREPLFRLSHHVDRALSRPRPTWRGRTHRVAAVLTVPLGIWLVVSAPAGAARVACLLFFGGTLAMFTASGLMHLRTWSPHTTEIMVRIDHSGIYLAIGGTASAVAILGMASRPATIALWVVWSAVVVGLVIEWLPFASPRGLTNAIYLTLGWGSIVTVPFLWSHSGAAAVVLLLAGGVLYTVGVVVLSRQRPDPRPEVFGYHEIWHLFVIAAVALHWLDVAFVLL